ncbi:uncharacterized protein LOC110846642 isoform X2 [Folsomia candida]|uniref:uncharacterized protein LOC110846642 isoform X2 n=1 Tax=Folsomia candida TaxID=158441 RepID=UPI000B8FCD5C|nr:uncharacterized protein LOC110846642 isoform X2 [Folsomia candida]
MKSARDRNIEDVLLYIPNLIAYFLILYCISISLDLFDGWSARKFNQCSAFGAWLDVIIDNMSRTCIWTNVCTWSWIIVSIEWTTFVCNHQAGARWKEDSSKTRPEIEVMPPRWVLKIMENGFKTPLGTWVILGLHCLPVWIFAMQHGLTDHFLSYATSVIVCLLLLGGRLLCLGCELWCIKKHIIELLNQDFNN